MSIAFMPVGSEIYWVLERGTQDESPALMTVRRRDGVWGEAERVTAVDPYGATEIHISPDGGRLYFVSARPWPESWGRGAEPGSREARRVWHLEREGEEWSAPRALPRRVTASYHPVTKIREVKTQRYG